MCLNLLTNYAKLALVIVMIIAGDFPPVNG